jgi:hypothetical protein
MAEVSLAIRVPADDGAIQKAFEILDAQMDAWLSAMRRIDVALKERAETQPETPEVETPDAAIAAAVVAKPRVEAVASASVNAPVVEKAASPEPTKSVEPIAAQPHAAPAAVAMKEPEPVSTVAAAAPACEPVAHTAVPAAPENDDETLLASLDQETAKAIRVMRRLSVSRKSVRELLAEYQAKQAQQPAAGEKKSRWWRGK